MKPWILCASLLSGSLAFAQQPSGKPAFEVASIKPAEPSPANQIRMNRSMDAGRVKYTNFSLRDLIRTAYRVKDFQVDGPEWIGTTRFIVEAKLPEGGNPEQIPEMLQALLVDRFELTLHRETREHAVYALVAGKNGPKLKPVETAGDGTAPGGPARGAVRPGAMQMTVDDAGAHLKASTSLSNLSEMISRFSELPVVDLTGITGDYEFDLVFSPEVTRGPGGGGPNGGEGRVPTEASTGAGSIYDSVQRYGLKLEPRKMAMEILTVDSIQKAPTEN